MCLCVCVWYVMRSVLCTCNLTGCIPCYTLGVTKFDLLGHFGDIKWIRNRWLVLSYNIMFGSLTGLVFIKKVTSTLIREAYHAFRIHKWKNIVVNRKYRRLKSSQSD